MKTNPSIHPSNTLRITEALIPFGTRPLARWSCLPLVLAFLFAILQPVYGQLYDWRNLAGDPFGANSAGDPQNPPPPNTPVYAGYTNSTTGSDARFWNPTGLAVDSAGNAYVADEHNHIIRKITPAGAVTLFAGTEPTINPTNGAWIYHAGYQDGFPGTGKFTSPYGLAVDSNDNVYVADRGNHAIRKITQAGYVTTFAGADPNQNPPNPPKLGFANGSGYAVRFYNPTGVAVGTGGNVYVADTGNYLIRKITPGGTVTTFAGTEPTPTGTNSWLYHPGHDDLVGTDATFRSPTGVAVDAAGKVYVADGSTIRKITPAASVSTLAGWDSINSIFKDSTSGSPDAQFHYTSAVAVDALGNVYVTEWGNGNSGNNAVRKISPTGAPNAWVTSIAKGGWGCTDGLEHAAKFRNPWGVAVDPAGFVFVVDSTNCRIARGTPVAEILVEDTKSPFDCFVWYMDHNIHLATDDLPTVGGANVRFVGTGDFNGDGHRDIVTENINYGSHWVWYMKYDSTLGHLIRTSSAALPTRTINFQLRGIADFNGDGKPDLLWQDTSTGNRTIWYMDGTTQIGSAVTFTTLSTDWDIACAGDFNGDSKPDIVWQNTSTGLRTVWFMDGAVHTGSAQLGTVGVAWEICGAGDFNGDGQPDLLWQYTGTGGTGARTIWYMNGTTHTGSGSIGTLPTTTLMRQ